MKRANSFLPQNDKDLLRRFKIQKEVQIKLRKLKSKSTCGTFSHQKSILRDPQQYTISKQNKILDNSKQGYPCQLCSKSFFARSALHSHLATHTKEKQFMCQYCNRTLSSKERHNYHEIVCNQNPKQLDASWIESQKRFQCILCNKKMNTNHHLTDHLRTHTQEKPFNCDKCDYAAALASTLRRHIERRHNPNKIKNFVCTLCPKVFYTNSELYRHVRTHTQEKSSDSVCGYCKNLFTTVGGRRLHEIICKLNPKQSDEDWLREQKKFKCKSCEYSSLYGHNLKRHMMSHTGEKPFECSFCPMRTMTKVDLYRHLGTHTNEKPHKCPHCDYTSIRNSKVMDHVHLRHSER